jgi:Ca2+-transporting ATPase
MIFVTIIIGELLRTYSARSEKKFLFQMNPFDNRAVNYAVVFSLALLLMLVYVPFLASLFRIEALTFGEFLIAGVLGFLPMIAGELTKLYQPHH